MMENGRYLTGHNRNLEYKFEIIDTEINFKNKYNLENDKTHLLNHDK